MIAMTTCAVGDSPIPECPLQSMKTAPIVRHHARGQLVHFHKVDGGMAAATSLDWNAKRRNWRLGRSRALNRMVSMTIDAGRSVRITTRDRYAVNASAISGAGLEMTSPARSGYLAPRHC